MTMKRPRGRPRSASTRTTTVQVRMDDQEVADLDQARAKLNLSRSAHIRYALRQVEERKDPEKRFRPIHYDFMLKDPGQGNRKE